MRLAAGIVSAAALAECLRLEGAWQVQAESVALRVLDTARLVRQAAPRCEVDPDEAYFAAVLRGLGAVLLTMQAARRYAGQPPAPELLSRLEVAGPQTAGAMLVSWGVPQELLDRFAVPTADGSAADTPMVRLLENPLGRDGGAEAVASDGDWTTRLRATRETLGSAFQLAVGADVPVACALVTEELRLPARLEMLGARGARVVLDTPDLHAAVDVLGAARAGLWLDVRLGSSARGRHRSRWPARNAAFRCPPTCASWDRCGTPTGSVPWRCWP